MNPQSKVQGPRSKIPSGAPETTLDLGPGTLDLNWLGRIGYAEALALQEKTVVERQAGEGRDVLFLLEHEPVYTIGRTPDQSSLRSGDLPHPVISTNRGGQATFHGPGQLVGYPIIDLNLRKRDLHLYLRVIEELLIEALALFDVKGERRVGLTGVWVEDRKIASIGVGVRKWITMHGFALNVASDLAGFSSITPCGIDGVEMTSLSREAGREISVHRAAETVGAVFAEKILSRLAASSV